MTKMTSIPSMGVGEMKTAKPGKSFVVLNEQWQLLLELCHFTQDLNPLWQTKSLQTQLKSLSEPILERLQGLTNPSEKFQAINHYFFSELGFNIASKNDLNLQNCFLPYVFSSKQGPSSVLMLIYSALLEECQIPVQVSSSRKKFLLKIQIEGKAHIVDFGNKGQFLQPYEIVDLINRGFDFSNGCLDSNILVIEYLNLLKKLSREENKLQILSMTHSYLMKYQPFNLKHISARAMVAYETGDYRKAVEDIRNYFQYKQADFTNDQLRRIYKIARKRQKTKPQDSPEA